MRNIILFIRRFFILVVFFVLQGICIAILVRYNKTYEAVFANSATEITGRVDNQYNKVEYFFHLKKTNKQLSEENARLRNMLATNYIGPEVSTLHHLDTTFRDTTGKVRIFSWLPAKVVNNSFSEENNYLTLYRGEKQGVEKDMAVTGPDGIVGKVVLVSSNYCRVMSLLNRNSKVSAMLKKELYTGAVEWDGADPRFVTLKNIPKSAKVVKGDTVLTSNLSGNYPPGLMIGTVELVQSEQASNFYTMKVKTATNFFNLQYAYLIQNETWKEQKALEAQVTPK
ncbi:rod shape-determining protein MreC [Filimonas zeae]|uniref:Cell shape-determining protein MreC n=1 Tax=Filimonas zeae TaxID=1737353 RepID=A0A917MXZ0_9BACT|nr:rod shape-determining protein MreC [Filimonas zeae]MDR6341040.1 rod shape-determining protein MreC [Filimonas zeae]GGH77466.1 cell shape-determining protein MreC [Filimonas zeae]